MRYEFRWRGVRDRRGRVEYRPFIPIELRTPDGLARHPFLVDSGADSAMAPRYAFPEGGIPWERGKLQVIKGVSRKRGCEVSGRIHEVIAIISETDQWLTLPICFVDADVPFVVGRQVFFDFFRVCFDKINSTTIFETKHV